MENAPLLIADIGGTNARFALASAAQPYFDQAQTYQCIDFENIDHAIESYLSSHNINSLKGMCFAVAGTIINNNILTNNIL